MFVSELMHRRPSTVGPATTVADAAEIMSRHKIGYLPVVHHGRLIGVLTDRDIVVRSVSVGADPIRTRVDAIMTRRLVKIGLETDVEEGLRLMGLHHLRRLPLTDGDHLLGIASLSDLADSTTDATELERTVAEVGQRPVEEEPWTAAL